MDNLTAKRLKFLLALVLLMLLFRYPIYLLNSYRPYHFRMFSEIISPNTELVYFGDSVPARVAYCDEREDALPEIVSELGDLNVVDVSIGNTEMLEFLEYNKIVLRYSRARYVVIPLKPTSFNTTKVTLNAILRGSGASFISIYEPFRSPKVADMLNIIFAPGVSLEQRGEGRTKFEDMAMTLSPCQQQLSGEIKQTVIQKIQLQINSLSQEMDARPLKWSVDKLKSKGIFPIVYISPVDIEFLKKNLGEESLQQMRRHLDLMRDVLNDEGISYIDLSESLSGEHFLDRWCGCGHLSYSGKQHVAKAIIDYIDHIHPHTQ